MADMAHYAGLVAAGLYPSPVGVADFVTSTTHKTLRGPRGGFILPNAEHEKVLNSAVFPGMQGGPLMHVIAAKAVAFKEAMTREFKAVPAAGAGERAHHGARAAGARLAHRLGAHRLPSLPRRPARQGADRPRRGDRARQERTSPSTRTRFRNDPQKPMVTSGMRIGSPAMTTRGFKEVEAETLANLIADVLDAHGDDRAIARVAAEVKKLCDKFPVYGTEASGVRREARHAAALLLIAYASPLTGFDEVPLLQVPRHPGHRLPGERRRRSIRRRRKCAACSKRFTTYETVELRMPQVVKQDGSRAEFDLDKLRTGFMRALHKRPVPTQLVDEAVATIAQDVLALGRARDRVAAHRGDGDARAAQARRGGLHPLRLGLPQLPGHRRLPGRDQGSAAARQEIERDQ